LYPFWLLQVLRKNQPKTNVVVIVIRIIPITISNTTVLIVVVPRTTAKNTVSLINTILKGKTTKKKNQENKFFRIFAFRRMSSAISNKGKEITPDVPMTFA
jgi:hypothetical protein